MPVVETERPWVGLDYASPEGVYDEVYAAPGVLRPQWRKFHEAGQSLTAQEFDRRTRQAEQVLLENGVTFNVFAEGKELQRPWRLDLLPLILEASEWEDVEAGLSQRARLLNALIEDVYGAQESLRQGWLPPEAVYAHPGFQREFHNLADHREPSLMLYAAELARSPGGQWWVMADRSAAPAGAGFALENRIILGRTLPQVIHTVGVQRLATFFIRLQNALKQRAPKPVENPRIVLLTSGPKSGSYFEDVYLARYLGYTLVEGSDLAVRDQRVFLKTLAGLVPVDVIFSRGGETGLDPLELGGQEPHGIGGLLQAIRAGNVAVANVPGCALVESPIFMAFLPSLCRMLLGEDLMMPSIATWWCGQQRERQYVLDHLDKLVIKPAFEASGGTEIIPSELSRTEKQALRERLIAQGQEFVAQEFIQRSAAPMWDGGRAQGGHVAVRCFLTSEETGYSLMPGGLVRVAATPGPMPLSILAGSSSKDLWVRASGPVEPVTLLLPEDQPVPLRRSSALFPSRVADDLFWLGHALDRSEFLAKLLRAVVERMTNEVEQEVLDLPQLIRVLADQGQIEPGFAVKELSEQLPAVERAIPRTVFDDSEPRGLARAVSELRRLSARTRDWLSPDTWRQLQQAASTFLSPRIARWDDLGDVLTALNQLLVDLSSVGGMLHNGMIRGPSWRFLDIGRRIERARNIGGLLQSVVAADNPPTREMLKGVIEILDCRMTYRSRYLDNVQLNAVLDLAITDETNPNSIGFQIVALSEHMDALPQAASTPLRTEEKRLVMSAVHLVRMLTREELADPARVSVRSLLERMDRRLWLLTDVLNRRYLVHSGSVRQILSEPPQ